MFARIKFNILIFIFFLSKTMKQTVKHSLRIEYEKSWKYLFHLLRVLQGIILELSRQITNRLCEVMNFCGTFCENIARIEI